MRKAIIGVNPKFMVKLLPEGFFDNLEHIEGKALLRLDFEKRIKIAIVDIKMKEGTALKDLKLPKELTIVDVLKEKDDTYTCLVKVKYKQNILNFPEIRPFKLFMAENIIFDFPFRVSKDKIVFSVITDSKYLRAILKILKPLGFIESISFHKPVFSEYSFLSCLTERQKEVITAAKKHGYYEVPREITVEELSKKLGISKATTVEHLRKAENRIISSIMAGY
jgi:predicted DNA binding protein